MRSKLLIIPAWYPCSFFKEQADLVRDIYDVSILTGTLHRIGLRKSFRYFVKKDSWYKIEHHEDYTQIDVQYINHLYPIFERKQIDALTKQVGDVILSMYNGGKPNVIHIQSISDLAIFVVRWAKANNIRVVLTEHILFVRHETSQFAKMREWVYENVDKVLCVSNYVYRNLLTSGFKIKNSEVIGNLVNDTYVQYKNDRQKNGKILFVANHYHDKGLDVLFQVAAILKQKTNITIDVAGLDSDSLYNATTTMKTVIQTNGLGNEICLLGTIEHKDLLQMYPNYSLLLSTSRSETFGLAVAESILCGTRVVCTDSGGIRDFVNERNGMVVGINDIEGIVNAIMCTISSVSLSIEESKNISNRYGRKNYSDKLLLAYQK